MYSSRRIHGCAGVDILGVSRQLSKFGDGNYFRPITVRRQTSRANQISDLCCGCRRGEKKKRMPRCGASSPAGESSVERVLDGGGVPLMRERAKEGTDLARIGGLLHSSAGYC